MNTFAIFLLIALARVTETLGQVCQTHKDCQFRHPKEVQYQCLRDQKICHVIRPESLYSTNRPCRTHKDCDVAQTPYISFYCDKCTQKCFSRPSRSDHLTERPCTTVKDCYQQPLGHPDHCHEVTKTCVVNPDLFMRSFFSDVMNDFENNK